ncbi:ABC transporter permease [Pseudonocardia sp. NPDC049635]|uniref:ABC transporter permease n=1 Tax=Pseudonocardia sp. NPDC049635 TaxID=3155506 RepID=UPI00340A7CB4
MSTDAHARRTALPPASAPDDDAVYQHALRARRRRTVYRISLGVAVPLALILLWEAAGALGVMDTRFIPRPSTVVAEMADGFVNGTLAAELAEHGAASLLRLAPGFLLGAFAGLVMGLLMGVFDAVKFGFGPVISATFPIPKVAIYPLLIVLFGIGDLSIVLAVAIGVFYMVCVNTMSGVVYSNPVYRDVATAFQIPKRIEYLKIVLPGALPSIMAGIRLGLGVSLIVLVATEFVGAQAGMGYYIWTSWQTLNITAMFSGLVVISLFGVLSTWLLDVIEVRLIPWSRL